MFYTNKFIGKSKSTFQKKVNQPIISNSLVGLPCHTINVRSKTLLHPVKRQAGLRERFTVIFTVIFLLLSFQVSDAQWTFQSSGTTSEIWGMQFLNANTGLIVGANVLKRTTNGGTTWNNVGTAGFNVLREVIIWYGNVWGVTAGHSGAWRTTNEGLNWSTTFATSSYYCMDVKWTGNELYCAGQGMNYGKTTNWGASWTSGTFSVPGTVGFDVYGINVTNNVFPTPMWICGSSANNGGVNTPKLAKSTDGGATFSIVLNFPTGVMTGSALNDVEFTGSSGYVCSSNGRIFRTANFGASWDTTYLGNYSLRQFSFKNSSTGFVSGSGGQVFYTTNAGTNWNTYGPTGTTQNLNCIEFVSDNLLSAGASGTIIKRTVYLDEVNVSGAVSGNGNYLSLSSAFSAINSASQTGANIIVTINRDITEPATGAVLNQGDWSSLTIQPSSGSGKTISGNINAGLPLIDLNGADNVRIDGINSGGTSLTLSNSSTSGNAGTSTVRFRNDATDNKIVNCNILGSSQTNFTSPSATVLISGEAVATGNDNNVISDCNIGPAGGNTPNCAVFLAGTTSSPVLYNSSDTIRNCNIYDYFRSNAVVAGLMIGEGNTAATVTGNRFYQSGSRIYSSSNLDHYMIQINCPAGDGFTVKGNTLGFGSSAGTGTYTMHSPSQGNLYAMNLNVGTSGQTIIRGNTIGGIQLNGNWNSAQLINVTEGNILADSNTIGSQTANSITYTVLNSFGTQQVNAMKLFGNGNKSVNNNSIGGITANGPVCYFSGILFVTTGTPVWNCNGNTVGGGTANSLVNNATSGSTTYGISASSVSAASLTCSGNTIRNIQSAVTGTSFNQGTAGIYISIPGGTFTADNNKIHSVSNSNVSQQCIVSGLTIYAGTGTVTGNFIHSLSVANNLSAIRGISSFSTIGIFTNNMVSLGKDSTGTSITHGCQIYGIHDWPSSVSNYISNSIYISGSAGDGTSNTFALYSEATGSRRFTNNIFQNSRSNTGSSGKHYAIRVAGASANPSGLLCNYNDIFANGTGGVLGYFNSTDIADISSWRITTGKDTNSISSDPKFISSSDLHIDSNIASPVDAAGTPVAGITTDFDTDARNWVTPDIGADEFNGYKLAEALNFDGVNDHVTLPNSLTQAFTSPSVMEFTIEYWFKGTTLQSAVRFQPTGFNYIVAGWGSNPASQKHIMSTDGGTPGGVLVGSAATDGNWHHIAVTWKRNTVNGFRSYLDGMLVDQRNAADVNLPPLTSGGGLGRYFVGNSEFTNGSLDEVRIWTRALEQSEIAANMNYEINSATGLLASYHFNQGVAGRSNSGITSLIDATSNNFAGTLQNFALNGQTSNWIEPGPNVLPPNISVNITAIPEGLYNASSNAQDISDTIKAYLHSNVSPFNVVDSAIAVIDSVTHISSFTFANVLNGNYYIKLKHRNSIETWSAATVSMTGNTNYDFTSSASQAFGSNMIQVDSSPVRFAIYSGDVNQDGTVDATDVSTIDNDAANFVSGYVSTDLTGDGFVDGTDFAMADNNAANFVSVIRP